MLLTLSNLKLRPMESEKKLISLCEKKLRAPCRYFRIVKKSLDARDKRNICWVYTVECAEKPQKKEERVYAKITKSAPPVYIVGAGPAGLFCALRLLFHGIKPIVIERGKRVEEREKDIQAFFQTGVLNPHSNVQFGEGGAGTFSDGKLNTQTNTPFYREMIDLFLQFGAPEEIAYLSKPHIGSDNLKKIVAQMRQYILQNGGEIRYQTTLTDIEWKNGALCALYLNGQREEAKKLVLAIGHSARDTFEMLYARGFCMEQKEFAVGVRIEHLQSEISRAQYGVSYPSFPPADYKLVSHASERAAFSFCMCPGGFVMPATSELGGVVVNGMSNFLRDHKNANSALVVQVKKCDFESEHPLSGVAFQRKIERAAYEAGGGEYKAPVQLTGDFLENRESTSFGQVLPTYERGVRFAPVQSYLPSPVVESLKAAIPDMNRRLLGFSAHDSLLTGVESRTSSPVRIVRGEDMQSVSVKGVYPCGEGCGYAGGITSAAADGLKVAQTIENEYNGGMIP